MSSGWGVPVAGGDDGQLAFQEGGDVAIQDVNGLKSRRQCKAAAREEVILDIDDEQRILGTRLRGDHCRVSSGRMGL